MKTPLEEYNQILQSISTALEDHLSKRKAGRPPEISNLQILALFILSYKTLTPVLILAKRGCGLCVLWFHHSFCKMVGHEHKGFIIILGDYFKLPT